MADRLSTLALSNNLEIILRLSDDLPEDADYLLPYKSGWHGSSLSHRAVRDLHRVKYSLAPGELHPSHHSRDHTQLQELYESKRFEFKHGDYVWDQHLVQGRVFTVNDPALTLSVVEPDGEGGCAENSLTAVSVTAQRHQCQLAFNAGFFNITSGACLGNVVSDGRLAADAHGLQNAHFGITKTGKLFYGFVPEKVDLSEDFHQLVGGVVWLVRGGENYVDISKEAESQEAETTGSLQQFIDVTSARLAVGNDKDGRVVIVQIEGKTWERGVNLYTFADFLISLGVVNAINLDGGGSVTSVFNNTVLNYSGDRCEFDKATNVCERNVSTVLCIHDIVCHKNCSNNGDCFRGKCYCHDNWAGSHCDKLLCGKKNCSGNGLCYETGCACFAGWSGSDCDEPCLPGYHGINCRQPCHCLMGSHECNRFSGRCVCPAGYTGYYCERECGYGYYGEDCRGVCECDDGCACHHVTGFCHNVHTNLSNWNVGQCYADLKVVKKQSIVLSTNDMRDWAVVLLLVCIFGGCSLVLNIVLVYLHFIKNKPYKKQYLSQRPSPRRKKTRSYVAKDTLATFPGASTDSSNDFFNEMFAVKKSLPEIEQDVVAQTSVREMTLSSSD